MSAVQVPVVGIIGGIGSGKTAIATALRGSISVCLLDADHVGHEVLTQQSVKDELVAEFGNEIIGQSGEILRPQLAAMVFGTEEQTGTARRRLDEITHPRILEILKKQISEYKDQRACDVIILDAALLLEAEWASACNAIVYLEVPERIRLQRVLQRGWTEQQFRDREASQLPLQIKKEASDVIINNDADIESAAGELSHWIQAKFPRQIDQPLKNNQ